MLPEYCFPVSENAYENGRCVRRRNSMASVTLKNVKKIYPFNGDDAKKKKKKKGEEATEKKVNLQITDKGVVAVQEFSLDIKDKEFIVLVGPSGCGKSTTLRMIAGLEEISEGELYIGDRLVNDVAPKDRDIAMVFQNYALYPHMTVYENMAFALKLRHAPKDEIDKKVKEAAEILDITQYLGRKPKALSGGQRQRVAIGRAIVRNPQVMLMRTKNGCFIDVEVQVADGYGYDIQCEVVCENGTVKLPDPYAVVRRSRPAGWDSVQPAESMPIMTDWKERFIEAYDIEFCKWVESVHAGKLTGPSSWDGYVACVAGDALNASRGTSQFMKVETMEKPEMYK